MANYLRPALLPLLLCACACSSTLASEPSVSPETMARFTADMLAAVRQQISPYGTSGLAGVVELTITLNRQSQPIACSASKGSPRLAAQLPAGTVTSDAQLAKVAQSHCWLARYPQVPEALFDEKGTVEVIAPLVFMPY